MKTLAFVALLPVLALTACAEPGGETPAADGAMPDDAMAEDVGVADTMPAGPALSDVAPEQVGEAPATQDMPAEVDREFAPES